MAKKKQVTMRSKDDQRNVGSAHQLAEQDQDFQTACAVAGINPTSRQYKKYRGSWGGVGGKVSRRGKAFKAHQEG